jgi:ABC-2 type transport system ATP-binding protein
MSAVELAGLGKRYGRTVALADVDVTFDRGVTGLLGQNGAGKTTLLRIVATSIAADSGQVRLLGHDPHRSHADLTAVRRDLGYLPQELGYPGGFTAYGFVNYMAVLKEWDDADARRAEVRRVLEQVSLEGRATKRIRALSGGQRRRVGLAQALLGPPDLLVLDEPTTGLDPEQRVSLRRVLAEAGRDSTVVVATHQTEDVAALCERVVVIDDGRIRFDGAVRDMVAQADGRVWLSDEPDPRAMTSWRTGTGRYRNLGSAAERVAGAEPAEPSLEDAYLLLRGVPRDEGVAA